MSDLIAGWDAAFCPDPLPDDTTGVVCEVYLGGSSAFRRSGWSGVEVGRVLHMPRLPVWVPTPGVDNPRQAAMECLTALTSFHVAATTPEGVRQRVLVDLETGREPDDAWLDVFAARLWAAGYGTSPYCSESLAGAYKPHGGKVIAKYQPDGQPDMTLFSDPHVIGIQYRAEVATPGGPVDLDLFRPGLLPHLWV